MNEIKKLSAPQRRADKSSCRRIETYSKNIRAIALYERLGFKIIKIKKSFMMKLAGYGHFVMMELDIEQA